MHKMSKKNNNAYIYTDFFFLACSLALEIQIKSGPKLVDFKRTLSDLEFSSKIKQLREEVENFSSQFPMPGNSDI